METIRCAICRQHRSGEVKGDELLSPYRREGALARKVRDLWVCAHHTQQPLTVKVGDPAITHEGNLRIECITAVRPNGGFNIGAHTSFNVFGVRIRGFGNFIRLATPADLARRAELNAEAATKREAANLAQAQREKEKQEITAAFLALLPPRFADQHITVQQWEDGKFEISLQVTREQLAAAH